MIHPSLRLSSPLGVWKIFYCILAVNFTNLRDVGHLVNLKCQAALEAKNGIGVTVELVMLNGWMRWFLNPLSTMKPLTRSHLERTFSTQEWDDDVLGRANRMKRAKGKN